MNKYYKVKQGDTYGAIDYSLTNANGNAFVIPAGATVKFYLEGKHGGILVNGSAATITDAATGKVSYSLKEGDLLGYGQFYGEFRVVLSDGKIKSFPETGHLLVDISKSLGGTTTELLIKLTEIEDYKTEITAKVDQQITIVNDLITKNPQPSEVVEARGGEVTLGTRLDKTMRLPNPPFNILS